MSLHPGAAVPVQVERHATLPRDLPALLDALPPLPLPTATYRVQFHAGFTFRDARRLAPYLHALGISHLYASPYLRARSGSTHGYDVADPSALNPELGSEEDYAALTAELARLGMGQLVDIVPNHMGIGDPGNFRWLDVLENGPSALYAPFFDIDWKPLKVELGDQDRVILPVLGDQYGRVLERGELALRFEDGAFWVHYYEHRFPVAPDTYPQVLQLCLELMQDELGRRHEHVQELASIITAVRHLPPRGLTSPAAIEERNREKEIVKRRLRLLHAGAPLFRTALERALATFNGASGDPSGFDRLDALLGDQSYRLAFWRVAAEEINYRRFFDISELAAVRMEDPHVFEETHRLLLRLVREGAIHGLRIDHPDGLRDPAGYFWRLQQHCFAHAYAGRLQRSGQPEEGGGAPGLPARPPDLVAWLEALFDRARARHPGAPLLRPFYLVVEKILSSGEELPLGWPVHGTTGYDFLNVVNGLFVARENERFFTNIYGRFIRQDLRYRDLVNSTKKMVMLISLASEVNELAYALKRLATADRRYRDFTLNSLAFAIREVIAALRVYRTYIDPETGAASERDRGDIAAAVAEAKRRNPRTDPSIFEFVRDTLLGQVGPGDDGRSPMNAQRLQFVARFQQTTGPVMAKGVEDTAFYVYNRLVSLNEVGGEPDRFGHSVAAFHRHNLARARQTPATLLTTSTHDTKRSEDVRARIDVLSELPREWQAALTRWSRLNGRKKATLDGRPVPDRNEEYLLYQTLLGAWPVEPLGPPGLGAFRERIAAFMLKAVKEAKVNTSWINPNAAYEAAVQQFVHTILDDSGPNPFLDDFRALAERVSFFGALNSLSQTLFKLTCPGVPDIYQGSELWDFSLVDPDNRRAVDYERRVRLLEAWAHVAPGWTAPRPTDAGSRAGSGERGGSGQGAAAGPAPPSALASELLETWRDGRIKLWVTHRGLLLRRAYGDLFTRGSYTPLRLLGQKRRHACAFARTWRDQHVVVVAPVLVAGLVRFECVPPVGGDVWRDTTLLVPVEPGRSYRDVFTGATVRTRPTGTRPGLPLAEVLARFPVAALIPTDAEPSRDT